VWVTVGGVLLSVLDPHGRLVFILLFAPFYVLWALLFSYETRTLAMDLPFAADCFACGAVAAGGFWLRSIRFVITRPSASVARTVSGKAAKRAIKKAQQRKGVSKRALLGPAKWLIAGGVFLGGIIAWGPLSGWLRSSGWLLEMVADWKW